LQRFLKALQIVRFSLFNPHMIKGIFLRLLAFAAFFWTAFGVYAQEAHSDGRAEALRKDFRYLKNGSSIIANGYVDQPYMLILPDGSFFCVYTTARGREGGTGQHIVCAVSKDKGQTWGAPIQIESPTGPAASWATPYITPYGRIYVFYSYNGQNIRKLNNRNIRNDMLGWYCYRYSDDFGRTWSDRCRLPVRLTECDKTNDWEGLVQIFWGIDKPVNHDGSFYMSFSKLGRYMLEMGEGWLFKCDNIDTEKNPEKLNWVMLPEGQKGIRNPEFGSVQEEHNMVGLNSGGLYCVYRTRMGFMGSSYSRDGGKTWDLPEPVRYADGGKIKNPRACPKLYKTTSGRYLLWFHNHSVLGMGGFANRNPAWIAGGIEKDGKIIWSQPEILLYDPDDFSFETGRFSYPDFIDDGENYWFTETQKSSARIHKPDRSLFDGIWAGIDGKNKNVRAEAVFAAPADSPQELVLPDLRTGGFSLELEFNLSPADLQKGGKLIFDSRNADSEGLWVELAEAGSAKICLYMTREYFEFSTDVGALKAGLNHLVLTFDGLARIATIISNGDFNDGGFYKSKGWERISYGLGAPKKPLMPILGEGVRAVRLYPRALRTYEAIANFETLQK